MSVPHHAAISRTRPSLYAVCDLYSQQHRQATRDSGYWRCVAAFFGTEVNTLRRRVMNWKKVRMIGLSANHYELQPGHLLAVITRVFCVEGDVWK